jgi:23S rRNA (pseudouridine1915-N3)-methyltransferase
MKITLLVVGKTNESWLQTGIVTYEKRLKHYLPFQMEVIPELKTTKNLTEDQIRQKEAESILAAIKPGDSLVLLDEKGDSFTSEAFAGYLQKRMNAGIRNLVFVVGGPYGFSPAVYQAANESISLSEMTFSHQMVRLFFVEQLYRAMTIIKGEPYHHR